MSHQTSDLGGARQATRPRGREVRFQENASEVENEGSQGAQPDSGRPRSENLEHMQGNIVEPIDQGPEIGQGAPNLNRIGRAR